MKNKWILIVVILLCFIPSAVAYASFKKVQNAPVDEKTAVQISIDDINGKKYTLTREKDGEEADSLISFFVNLQKNASQIVALPDSLMGEKCFNVTLSTNVRNESSEFYFSTDPTVCYYRASDGKTYKIDEADATEFITSIYAESLYNNSELPTLTLAQNTEVTPDSATWQYKNYTGSYVESDVTDSIKSEVENYNIEGGLSLNFDTAPDYCNVKITDKDGNSLFDNPLTELYTFTISNTELLNLEITAKWYEDPSRAFCGELGYSFQTLVTAPADFLLGMSSVESGKFIAITATNVAHPGNITVESSLVYAKDMVFYPAENNMAVGLLPISVDTPSGQYTIKFTYGSTEQESTLTVVNGGEKISTYTVPESVLSVYHTKEAIAQFTSVAEEIMSSSSTKRYFSGYFLEGMGGDNILLRGFGRDVYLNGSTTVSYKNNGVDYRAFEGTNILACNAGKVVYAGMLDYPGYIVVIEHGYGLKTWYYNMGSIKVSVGDEVARGDVVGTAGKTGFTGETGAHIAMSVGKTFVSPYDTWKDSSIAAKVIIPKIDS